MSLAKFVCVSRYWKSGQLFLKCLTRVAVCALLKISLSISQSKGRKTKPMGFLEMPGNILFLLLGEEKICPAGSLFQSWPLLCQFIPCFFILPFQSDTTKCWITYYVLVGILSLVWSRTIKLLKRSALINNFNNYMENSKCRMMING